MAASTTASNLAGVWFGELASALQGTWQQAVAASHHWDQRPDQPHAQQKLGGHSQSQKKAVHQVAAAAGRKKAAVEEDVGRCGGAMSDATVYLLLDRFAPS
ncbi:hypothetical protein BS78_08G127500 [Paspalum vaginatum]|nr:hypothetical protein BS78_08G127500 [Paspalum vaginatum]